MLWAVDLDVELDRRPVEVGFEAVQLGVYERLGKVGLRTGPRCRSACRR